MKKFEYAQKKNKRKFEMPRIKTKNYDIIWFAIPIAPIFIAIDKIDKWYRNRLKWDDKKAEKALNYFLPHVLEFVKEDNAYYYCMNWRHTGWDIAKKVPIGMKKWTRKFGYQILGYLEENYEKEGFLKSSEKDYYDTWIKFEKRG